MKKYFIMMYNEKMDNWDLEHYKQNIISHNWAVAETIPIQYRRYLLDWLNNTKEEIVKVGWPPNPNIYNSIKQLSKH